MQFSLPLSQADWLVFLVAAVTALLGLLALFAPRLVMAALRLDTSPAHPEAVAEIRGTLGGFWLGTGIVALLFYDQPFVQWTIGAVWLFAAFGRLVSILADSGSTPVNWAVLAVKIAFAAACLNPTFGLV